jgi:NADH-quinone oxidoreductase subunit N
MYGMAAYLVRERHSLEAGLKYLVLSAVASAFILFGMALVYSQSATMVFSEIGASAAGSGADRVTVILGDGLILIGIAFKISLAPFHLWTPDVYQGAPAPVAAFLATASKIAVFALLFRYFVQARISQYDALVAVLTVLAILSIAIGNIVALCQSNLKRLLGYSAIAHFGYVLVALIASGPQGSDAAGVYLLTYSITTLAAFGVIALVSSPYTDREVEELSDYRGLFWKRPGLALILTLALLSLAGVPLTAGFLGKFYVLSAGVDRRQWLLLAAIVSGSAVGLYYYLRAMIQLYLPAEPDVALGLARGTGGGALVVLLLLMLVMGVYPAPFLELARAAHVEAVPATVATAVR